MINLIQKNDTSKKNPQGGMLLELVIAFGLLFIIITPLIGTIVNSGNAEITVEKRQIAHYLLEESIQKIWSLRAQGWDQLPESGTYHLIEENGQYSLATGSAIIDDELEQEIIITHVNRDSDWKIVNEGGVLDPSTKKIIVNINYGQNLNKTTNTEFLLTRYLDNETLIRTTQAEFDQGEFDATLSTSDQDGEVILSVGGRGNWCLPGENIIAQHDLPMSARASVIRAIEGKIFTGTDWGNEGSFYELNVSQDEPPVISVAGSTQGYDTNDIFIDGNYAYIATDTWDRNIVIIDLSTNQEVGYFNANNWWGVAQGVYVVGNIGYTTIGNRLWSFDLSQKTGSRPALGSVDLSGIWILPAIGYRLQVVNNHAFVALDWGWAEMRIVDVSNPSNMIRRGSANVNSKQGKDIYVNSTGTRAYLVTSESSTQRELFILNTTNKTSISLVSSYDTNGMNARGISVVTGNKVLMVGSGGEEYQVVDISNEQNPNRCGGLNLDNGVYGVGGVLESDGDAYSYIVTKDPDAEIKIIEGGPGGQYAAEGIYTSEPIDMQSNSVINYLDFSQQTPENTQVRYQVAVANAGSNGCSDAQYVYWGPSGDTNSFFTEPDTLPLNDDDLGFENPGRCLRYRVYFNTSDFFATPVFEEVRINYSP